MVKRYGIGSILAVSATVLIWSTTFAALVAALDYFSPHHLLALRWTLTALLFIAYAVATRMRLPRATDVPRIAAAGMLGYAIYQLLLVTGQTGVTAAMAGFLINLSPVFTTVIAAALGRERTTAFTWVGLATCMGGLAVMGAAAGGLGSIGASAALIVAAALSFALYTIVSKPLLARYRPIELTTYALVVGSLPFLAFAPGALGALAAAPSAAVFNLVYLAALPGGIAYVFWARAVAGMPPGAAARFLYLIPVLGVPIAWVWVGETPQLMTVLGGLATVAGVAIAGIRGAARLAVDAPDRPAPVRVTPPETAAAPAGEAA